MAEVSSFSLHFSYLLIVSLSVSSKNSLSFVGPLKIFEIGQTGFFTEVESELKDKKAGRLGGMKNWYGCNFSWLFIHIDLDRDCLIAEENI